MNLVVLKLGGSVLADDRALTGAVGEVDRYVRQGARVIAVVSAQGTSTDRLVERATAIGAEAQHPAYASFLATGEVRSAAALVLAADQAGISASLIDQVELGLQTEGSALEADPVELHPRALFRALESSSLVVVPGFVGLDRNGNPTLLGRGGSDMTAVFLAARLAAERCVLLKDVDGWFVEDPAVVGATSQRYDYLNWADAIKAPAPIVQDRAVILARRLGRTFEVAGFGSAQGTVVGPRATRCSQPARTQPLNAAVLGREEQVA